MEDYDAPGLLVATTNVEASLDAALFRRFDDVFAVPLPGPEEIKRLLRMTLCAVQLAEPIYWDTLAKELTGASAAMVVKTAQDAAKAVVLAGGKLVTQTHLRQATVELRKKDSLARED
jgi:ATP-dependent 26S proteasome regulatory subunit